MVIEVQKNCRRLYSTVRHERVRSDFRHLCSHAWQSLAGQMSTPTSSTWNPPKRHALTAVEKQRGQLEKLLKDPAKLAYVPPPPKEKTIRPAREMMKNVQGSSAGAGSGEFHVYKASRRREYERIKLLEESSQKACPLCSKCKPSLMPLQELIDAEFERKRQEGEELANAKTLKNRAKRQKKKERSKAKGSTGEESRAIERDGSRAEAPLKKRRLVNGKELVFRQPGVESDEEEDDPTEHPSPSEAPTSNGDISTPQTVELHKIIFHEDD